MCLVVGAVRGKRQALHQQSSLLAKSFAKLQSDTGNTMR